MTKIRMRILILSQYFWPEQFKINDLVMSLHDRGHHVEVLTGQPNYPSGNFFPGYGWFKKWKENFAGAVVRRVPLWRRHHGGRIHLSLNYLSFIFSALVFGLPRVLKRYDCTFVFGTSPILSCIPAIVLKWLTGTPVVLWVQDLWPQSVAAVGAVRHPFLLRMIGWVVRGIYKNCDLIFVQSQAFTPNVIELGGAPEKIHYIPNWAEALYMPVLREQLLENKLNLPKGFRLMFAGNLGKAQSLETILLAAKALRHIPDLQWIFLGDGSDRTAMQELAKSLGVQVCVHFLGRFPASEMPSYFALADAMLVTLRREDIFASTIPSKVQTYMACGRPIVAALDGEGARVIAEAKAGFTGPAEDFKTLAANIEALYRLTAEERERLGANSIRYYRDQFDRDHVIQNVETSIAKLVGASA